jgi:hypothetical protein
MRALLLATAAVFTATAGANAAPIEELSNRGFEASPAGSLFALNAVPSWSGNNLAVVANSTNGVFLTFPSVSTTQGGGTNAALLSPLGVLDHSISQTFSLSNGHQVVNVSFQYFLQSLDLPIPLTNAAGDPFTVTLNGTQLFTTTQNDPQGGGLTQSGWQTFSTGFLDLLQLGLVSPTNTYTLTFSLNNDSSLGESTRLFVDNASVLSIPEPATLAVFGGIALAGAVGFRRRKATA